jgi:hypothetical protein
MSWKNLQWENVLNLVPAHELYEKTEDVDAAGKVVSESIRKLRKHIKFPIMSSAEWRKRVREELDELADSFENELCGELDEYNYFLDQLYDLGNEDKLIWVAVEQWQLRAS